MLHVTKRFVNMFLYEYMFQTQDIIHSVKMDTVFEYHREATVCFAITRLFYKPGVNSFKPITQNLNEG